jgi:hypothetical protein
MNAFNTVGRRRGEVCVSLTAAVKINGIFSEVSPHSV